MSDVQRTDELPTANRRPRNDELDVYGLSHPGLVRTDNQDHFLLANINKRVEVLHTNLTREGHLIPDGEQRMAYLAMVADGVGGGAGGGEASATAVQATMGYVDGMIAAYLANRDNEAECGALLQQAAQQAHEAVLARRAAAGVVGTMATTLTVYLGMWPAYYLLQVGDSRYYVYNQGTLRQVTRDQTVAQDLVDLGAMTRSAALRTPMAHVLSSAIGADATAPVVHKLASDWGNVHLLCSDGLTKHVSDARIAEVLGGMTSARAACEQLVADALAGGGTDNVTVVVGRTVPKDGG
ncbi:MAG: protein phosphatase 2C domain-containing protein [Gemmatimonadetes bacterium]|nr:protein phosphatase 2C domain-containing protein [Gemmatimonadota bacterium]